MTHEQVARTLDVPLGTAKTRIRSGLQIMRTHLAPMAATLLTLALAILGFRLFQAQMALDREERAVLLVTTSDVAPDRLTPAPNAPVPVGAHANYRGRPGVDLAVLSTELLPTPAAGETYQAWVRYGEQWTSLGTMTPNPDGATQLIAQDQALTTPPDAVEITLEPSPGSHAPTGQVVLTWPNG